MKPSEVLVLQADLLTRMRDARFAAPVLSQFGHPGRGAATLLDSIRDGIRTAPAYRVTEDMSTLVQHAARGLDASDTIDADLPPTPTGIVRFERPVPVREARGRTMLAHWMTWAPAATVTISAFGGNKDQPGLFLTWWNDTDEPDEVQNEGMAALTDDEQALARSAFGRWAFIAASAHWQGTSLGEPETDLPEEYKAQLLAENVDHPSATTNIFRYAHALWLMLDQQVTEVSEEPIREAQRRRAVRNSGITGKVSVVDLRHGASTRGRGESVVEWSRRWVVRGHWRWQPYGKDRAERRRIWITGYVKGPDDAPLVVSDKVYNVKP